MSNKENSYPSWKKIISFQEIENLQKQIEVKEIDSPIIFDLNSIIFKEMRNWWRDNVDNDIQSLNEVLKKSFEDIFEKIFNEISYFNLLELKTYVYFEKIHENSRKYLRYQNQIQKTEKDFTSLSLNPTDKKLIQKCFFESKKHLTEKIKNYFKEKNIQYFYVYDMHKTIMTAYKNPKIYTEDKDFLLFGANIIISDININNNSLIVFNWNDYLSYQKLNLDQMIRYAMLCGTNYNIGIEGYGKVRSKKIVQEFKNLNFKIFLDKFQIDEPTKNELIQRYQFFINE